MPMGITMKINQLLSKAALIFSVNKCTNAVVKPQAGQWISNKKFHRHGIQRSIVVADFKIVDKKKYNPAKAMNLFTIKYLKDTLSISQCGF